MLVLNTSQPKRVYTTPVRVDAEGQYILTDLHDNTTVWQWFDYSNKYIYFVRSLSASPWLNIDRYTYDTNWNIGSLTPITLSSFGTFTSAPRFAAFQGAQSANFHLLCSGAGGSASFAVNDVYPISISGTTATKGTALSVPSVASYDLNRVFAKGAVVYAFYSLTASPYTCDVGRKYSGSWSSLTSGALPSSVTTVQDDNISSYTYATEVFGGASDLQKCPAIGAGASFDKFYNLFRKWNYSVCLKFDGNTDTWSAITYMFDQVFWEISWNVIFHNKQNTITKILNTSLAEIWSLSGLSFWALSNSLLQWPIVDLTNWIWQFRNSTATPGISFFWFYTWSAKRLGKVWFSNLAGGGVIFKIDSNNWWNMTPFSTSVLQEMDYYWETTLTVFVTKTTGTWFAEITD